MKLRHLCVPTLALAGAGGFAAAAVTPVGEFVGQRTEGFEGILPPGGYPQFNVFGDAGIMSNTFIPTVVIATSWFGPGGDLLAFNGNFFGGVPVGQTRFQFNMPITDFGGQFATVESAGDATITFRDPQGALIDTLPLNVPVAQWQWRGWHSDTPVGSIEVTNGTFPPGGAVQYDELQATFVPEPGTAIGLAAIGAVALVRRRRR